MGPVVAVLTQWAWWSGFISIDGTVLSMATHPFPYSPSFLQSVIRIGALDSITWQTAKQNQQKS